MKLALPNLALFRRSLLLESRQLGPYAIRFILVVTASLFLQTVENRSLYQSGVGLYFFTAMTVVNLIAITVAGLTLFPSVITEEKEDDTLGLLVMTGLRPFTMLFSKTMTRFLTGVMLILVQTPFFVLAVTLGGVSVVQIWATVFLLLGYLAFACGLGVFVSVIASRNSQAAAMAVLGFLLFFASHFAQLGLQVWRSLRGPEVRAFVDLWASMSPFTACVEIFNTQFAGPVVGVQGWSNVLLGGLLFGMALMLFNRFATRTGGAPAPSRGFSVRGRFKRFALLAPGRAWTGGVAWKEFYFAVGGKSGILLRSCLYGVVLMLILSLCIGSDLNYRNVSNIRWERVLRTFWTAACVTVLWTLPFELSFAAERMFGAELRWKTHGSIMGLPRSPAYIAYQKLLGSLPALLPALTILVLSLVLSPEIQLDDLFEAFDEVEFWMVISGILLYLHTIVFTSFSVRHSVIAALAIMFFFYLGMVFFVGEILGLRSSSAGSFVLMVTLVITAALHWGILTRMEKAAH